MKASFNPNFFEIALITLLSGIGTFLVTLIHTISIGILTETILVSTHVICSFAISFFLLRTHWLNPFLSILFLFACSFASSFIIDLGADSQTAHIHSYVSILNGWDIVSLEARVYHIHGIEFVSDNYQTYLAGRVPYVLFAISHSLTGLIDSGKGVNLAFHISAAILFSKSLPFTKTKTRLILTSFVFMNPASIAQLNTHYIDHFIFIGFVLCALTAIRLTFYNNDLRSNHEQKYMGSILFAASVLLSGSKLPGVVFNIVLILGLCSFFVLQRRREYKQALIVIGISGLGSICGGFFPYVYGIDFSNSEGVFAVINNIRATSLAWESQSAWLNDTNTLQRLFQSIFSEYHVNPAKVPTYKLPGFVTSSEIDELAKVHPDARIGGFGPLFSFALCISLVIMALGLRLNYKQYTKCLSLFILLVITSIFHPYAFWARWAPQIWILPVLVLFWHQHSNDKLLHKLQALLALILGANIVLFSSFYLFNSVLLQINEREELQILIETSATRAKDNVENPIWFQNFHAWKIRLEEYGVTYTVLDGPLNVLSCSPENYGKLNRTQMVYCKDG